MKPEQWRPSMKNDEIVISNPVLSARVRTLGAELVGLQDASGTDYLWNGDPAWWASCSPILFPIVGELKDGKLKVDGRTFAMERHGFARRSTFEVVLREASHCAFRLLPNEKTRAQYPFEFELRLDYEVVDRTLEIRGSIANRGTTPMPASFGFHPGFRWPLAAGLPKTAYSMKFDRPETAQIRRPLPGTGLLSEPGPTPVTGAGLPLEDSLFDKGALIFDELESRRVVYGASSGPSLSVAFDGLPHLGIWTLPGAGYVCIEPWQGYASPPDFEGELKDKPGMLSIEPGATWRCAIRIEVEPRI